ncbi:hypothetical protein BIW11_06476 [Tropilaelaps mercedesae]|nr:hypothetical protein BIW11_06476 [Tropilaelaps mercedesae]
MPRGGLR